MIRQNIFLDYLTRDVRRLNGVFKFLDKETHLNWLLELINISVFLTGDYCLINPGTVLECEIAANCLMEKSLYIKNGLIRFPLKESHLDEFFDKKIDEYERIKTEYPVKVTEHVRRILDKQPNSLIHRVSNIGKSIIRQSEQSPDTDRFWLKILKEYSVKEIEDLRINPVKTQENGVATTWFGIKHFLPSKNSITDISGLTIILHEYLKVYDNEYNIRILKDVPYLRIDLGIGLNDLSYSYSALKVILETEGVWQSIANLNDLDMIELRTTSSYYNFIFIFNNITSNLFEVQGLKFLLSTKFNRFQKNNPKKLSLPTIIKRLDKITYFLSDFYIEEISDGIIQYNKKRKNTSTQFPSTLKEKIFNNKNKSNMENPVNIFISYSHKDEEFKIRLDKGLSALKRTKQIVVWEDSQIIGGQEWHNEIFNNLDKAQIILLLISDDFIASDFCYSKELSKAIERHNLRTAMVIPIIIKPCDWTELEFGELQAFPKDGKPVTIWENQDLAVQNIIQTLKRSIKYVKENLL